MTRPPRLLVCADTYPPQVNGVSVVTALSVEGLHRRGWEVAVISPRYPADASDVFRDVAHEGSRSLSVRVRSVPMPGYPEIRVAAPCRTAVRSLIQRFRPDVVHSATEFCKSLF